MRLVLWAVLGLLSAPSGGWSEQSRPAEHELISYVESVAKTYGVTITGEEVARLQLDEKVLSVLRHFSVEQLLEACKRMELYSFEAAGLKMNILPKLRDVQLSDSKYDQFSQTLIELRKKWVAQPVVPDPDGLLIVLGRDSIRQLDDALFAAKQRRSFVETYAALNKARHRLTLVIVQFPHANVKFVTPTKAQVDELLKSSEPQGMRAAGSPLRSSSDPLPWSSETDLNWARKALLEDGSIIYLCDGRTVLAAILFSDSQMRYFRDIKGYMPVPLSCWSDELVKLLQKK